MKWLLAIVAVALCGSISSAGDVYLVARRVIVRPVRPYYRVVRPRVVVPAPVVPVPVPVVPQVRIVPVPVQSCPGGQCAPQQQSQTGGDSFPDQLDGGELPDDLFGGIPDPRNGGGSGGSSGGHTAYIIR